MYPIPFNNGDQAVRDEATFRAEQDEQSIAAHRSMASPRFLHLADFEKALNVYEGTG